MKQRKKLKREDLQLIKEKIRGSLDVNASDYRVKITVHMGTCGISAGATPVMESLEEEIKSRNISDIQLTSSGCPGLCSQEPIITVERKGEEPVKYKFVDAQKARLIFNDHVMGGSIPEKYALSRGNEEEA
jgi:NADP-reducing hydrogenase subunit HndB